MAKNQTTPGLDRLVLRWMTDVGERFGAERVGDALTGALAGVAKTRAAVDRNDATRLSIANGPSRREYEKLYERLDALQSSVASLSRRLDVLARSVDRGTTAPPRTKRSDKPSASSSKKNGSSSRKRGYA